ncbi:MAG: cytochrome oxidase [Deltaproteobacteria bacterium]|nr:cytochrome oxidase [Deltaproteobacteria bacterium]
MVALQLLVSLLLVGGSLVLFVHSVRQRDFDHADRLSLAPLEDDTHSSTQKQR